MRVDAGHDEAEHARAVAQVEWEPPEQAGFLLKWRAGGASRRRATANRPAAQGPVQAEAVDREPARNPRQVGISHQRVLLVQNEQVSVTTDQNLESARGDDYATVYVKSVHVANFRGIRECTVELEPDLTVFLGCNNAGKSRVLRALAVALGAVSPDRDDLTVGRADEAAIDVILAPTRQDGDDETFASRVTRRLGTGGVQFISESPVRERFGWRTHIRRSVEGFGVRSDHSILVFDDASQSWVSQESRSATYEQRSLVEADLVETRRDLVEELARRGSPVRRVLDDLEVPDDVREKLEAELSELSDRIVGSSGSLEAVQLALQVLQNAVDAVGAPSLQPLPLRLEELARSVSIDLDTGSGSLPMRFHGAGARSLASLQVQSVLYERRLGRDGVALRPHPVSLVEEPESHLHPQAQFELPGLLDKVRGQVIVSTHSAHLATVCDARSLRMLRQRGDSVDVIDLRPAKSDEDAKERARRPSLHLEEMEKLRRLVERPFGELLFATAVVLGDGATERSLIPPLARHRLGIRAHGLCVVDPGSMASEHAIAVVKFAKLVGIPWILVADSDEQGLKAAQRLISDHGNGDARHVVWVPGDPGEGHDGATEQMFIDHDREVCESACRQLGWEDGADLLSFMKGKKGVLGRLLAAELISRRPWPCCPTAPTDRDAATDVDDEEVRTDVDEEEVRTDVDEEVDGIDVEDKDEPPGHGWPRPLVELMQRLDEVLPARKVLDG
jgi:putative ATP-dependent endonuclease of OLD family